MPTKGGQGGKLPKLETLLSSPLDRETRELVQRVGDGSIITRFDKTPPPSKPTDVVCPHFLELKWATGCPFSCAWCYLQGTLRFRPMKTKPWIKDFGKIEQHVQAFLEQADGEGELLNTGELADSLMYERNGMSFSKFIIPLFQGQDGHRLLFVTKSNNVKNLLEIDHQGKVVVSFSLNAPAVARRYEEAPSVEQRVMAAVKLQQAGYEVRIRIDPMVPTPSWQRDYKGLIDLVFSKLKPSRITLGSLRGLQSTINFARDKEWVRFLEERTNWGLRVNFHLRLEMYRTVLDYLKDEFGYTEVGLCKETLAVWSRLNLDFTQIRCNCIS